MNFLSRGLDALFSKFSNSKQKQLKQIFQQAAQALESNDIPVLKTTLASTTFDFHQKQSLVLSAIKADNVEGLKTVFQGTGTKPSEKLTTIINYAFGQEIQDMPMLPYAIGRGSEKISSFLASHPETDLHASCSTDFTSTSPLGGFYCSGESSVIDVKSIAHEAGMTEVAGIIEARLNAQKSHGPSI